MIDLEGIFPRLNIRDFSIEDRNKWFWIKGDDATFNIISPEFAPLRDKVLEKVSGRRTIVQAGGAQGMYPRLWANHFEHVITFEPTHLAFLVLNLNCADKANVTAFNAALHNKAESLYMYTNYPGNLGMNRVWNDHMPYVPKTTDWNDPRGEKVVAMRLDDLDITDCDAIQLDVEEWEAHALEGAIKTITACRPVITLETVTPSAKEFLEGLGYESGTTGIPDTIFYPKR